MDDSNRFVVLTLEQATAYAAAKRINAYQEKNELSGQS